MQPKDESKRLEDFSPLQRSRLRYVPPVPPVLANPSQPCQLRLVATSHAISGNDSEKIEKLFPKTFGGPSVELVPGSSSGSNTSAAALSKKLKVGVVLSGGQAPGGHNVIAGLYDYLVGRNPESILYGFIKGPAGIMKGDFMQITAELLSRYRNQGGFDIIGTGRDKIETEEQFLSSRLVCEKLGLDGLVVIGGDDSNTNAAVLAEYFKSHHLPTRVIGVPKTIDGDLKTDLGVEVSFGFDSACKVFSSLIGNIEADANSSQKYYHFIRLMGRSASHITLECALQTHPNITLIGEEVAAKRQTLEQITNSICQVISARADKGKNFGVVLLPEGLIEFVPEVHALISELNELLADGVSPDHVRGKLSEASRSVFDFLPSSIRNELLLERDPHGNVQVSLIETEKLLIHLVKAELKKRKASGSFQGKFAAMGHFFGYEGRCVMPSNFDAHYCYTLGRTAAALLTDAHVHHRHGNHHVTGYIATVRNLTAPVAEWKVGGIPLTSLMNIERRKGKDKPVIRKALVKLEGAPFKELCRNREKWALHECYRNPGTIQYEGIAADQPNITLLLEYGQQRCNSQRSAL